MLLKVSKDIAVMAVRLLNWHQILNLFPSTTAAVMVARVTLSSCNHLQLLQVGREQLKGYSIP